MKTFRIVMGAALICGSISCATNPNDKVDYSNEPIGMQLVRVDPSLKGKRFNTLLDFESPDDLVFVTAHPSAKIDSQHAHTGKQSADIGSEAKIDISSVMVGETFPGSWSLVGAYLWSDQPATVNLSCTAGAMEAHRSIDLPGGKWTPAFVDLAPLKASSQSTGSDDVMLTISASQPLVCDDLLLLQNDLWLVGGPDSDAPWSIRLQGFKIIGERPETFSFSLDSDEGKANGWHIDEISPMRARFSSTGATKRLTVYSDGRAYWDGRFRPLSAAIQADPLFAQENESPGEARVAEGMGRVNRTSAGDANNDGYNESLGAYQLIASGARIEFTLSPGKSPLQQPIVEIAGLPKGKPLVTVEGRLVETFQRLPDGHLLIEMPGRIDRPTSVNVRIE